METKEEGVEHYAEEAEETTAHGATHSQEQKQKSRDDSSIAESEETPATEEGSTEAEGEKMEILKEGEGSVVADKQTNSSSMFESWNWQLFAVVSVVLIILVATTYESLISWVQMRLLKMPYTAT